MKLRSRRPIRLGGATLVGVVALACAVGEAPAGPRGADPNAVFDSDAGGPCGADPNAGFDSGLGNPCRADPGAGFDSGAGQSNAALDDAWVPPDPRGYRRRRLRLQPGNV